MRDIKTSDQLFNTARNAKTELNIDQVNDLLENIPDNLAQTSNLNNWNNLLNFKNGIIMFSTIITIVFLITFNTNNNIESNTNSTVSNQKTQIVDNLNSNHSEPIIDSKNIKTPQTKTKAIVNQLNQINPLDRNPSKAKKISTIDNTDKIYKQNMSFENDQITKYTDDEILNDENPKEEFVIFYPKTNISQNESDLEKIKLRKLKRTLYKALVEDNLVPSKDIDVTIDLLSNGIRINGQKINSSLQSKYKKITEDAGSGENRKILLTSEFIKVGDFTKEGFRGKGFGRFTEAPNQPEINIDNKIEDPFYKKESQAEQKKKEFELIIENEEKTLKEFANKILSSTYGDNPKTLFGVNMKYEDCNKLHSLLYKQLIEDGFIDSKSNPVIIEFGKHSLKINGKSFDQNQTNIYRNIITQFKIKPGKYRSIRLTEHLIKVGDFGKGNFTGTSSIISK